MPNQQHKSSHSHNSGFPKQEGTPALVWGCRYQLFLTQYLTKNGKYGMLNVQFFVHVWSMKFDISDEKTSKNKSGNVSVWDSVNSGGLQNFIPLIWHGGIL